MENLEVIVNGYYSALYWQSLFYGMLVPTAIYLLFAWLTNRMLKRYFARFEAQVRDTYNELIIKDLESQAEFFKNLIEEMKGENQ